MRSDRPVQPEVLRLLRGDEPRALQRVHPRGIHRPPLPLGERLVEVREVGERLHKRHARLLETRLHPHVVVHALQVVDPGLERRLPVQAAPESGAAQEGEWLERQVREVDIQLLGSEIDVGEDHAPQRRLLKDLRSPAGGVSGVEEFAALEAQRLQDPDATVEPLARAVIRVVVLVRPADPMSVLPRLLYAPGTAPRLPVLALGTQPQPTRPRGPEPADRRAHKPVHVVIPAPEVVEGPPPRPERLQRKPRLAQGRRRHRVRFKAGRTAPLHRPAVNASARPRERAAERRVERTLRRHVEPLRGEELVQIFDLETESRARGAREHRGEEPGWVAQDPRMLGVFHPPHAPERVRLGAVGDRDEVEDVQQAHPDVVEETRREGRAPGDTGEPLLKGLPCDGGGGGLHGPRAVGAGGAGAGGHERFRRAAARPCSAMASAAWMVVRPSRQARAKRSVSGTDIRVAGRTIAAYRVAG